MSNKGFVSILRVHDSKMLLELTDAQVKLYANLRIVYSYCNTERCNEKVNLPLDCTE